MSQSTVLQSCLDISWFEPVLSRGLSVLLKDTMQCLLQVSNLQPFDLKSNTLPLDYHASQRSHNQWEIFSIRE